MGTGKDPRMREALQLARAGKQEQARQLLIEILKQNRDNADAWIVMAQVAESHKEAITCMKQALRLRPDDERAQRYLEFLLKGEQASSAPLGISPWLWGGLGTALVLCVAVALILFLSRPGSQTQTGESGATSGAQPVANPSTDCAALIKQALEVSDQGCDQVGRDQVCYGHNTVQAQLVPGSNARFDQPGNIIPVNILEQFIASPLDLQKGDWGVGVFRLEANLPGTLPGQLVTLLIFGNTTLQNTSGNMQAFYFSSGLGGISCDAVPFDGIMVNMANGAGIAFKANGTDITLQGNSILRAVANDDLVVTTLSGAGTVSALGQQQSLSSGQTVTVPMGGSNGMEANGPPSSPQPADDRTIGAGCMLTSQGCPSSGGVAEAAATNTPVPIDASIPTNTPAPIDPSIPTYTPVPVLPGQPTNTPVPLPTSTPVPLATNTPVPVSTVANTKISTDNPAVAATTPPPTTPPPTTPPPTTPPPTTPPPTTPPPTTPPPTTPPPTTPPPTTPPPTTPPPTTPPPTTPPPTTPPPTTPPPTVDVSLVSMGPATADKKVLSVPITNSTGGTITIANIYISWPAGNGNLEKIKLGSSMVWNSSDGPPDASIGVSQAVSSGTSVLEFTFGTSGIPSDGYTISLTFAEGGTKTFSQ